MKKLLGIVALLLAFAPFAQAQNSGAGLPGHPDARNDRRIESSERRTIAHHDRGVAKHMRHVKHHHVKHHRHVDHAAM